MEKLRVIQVGLGEWGRDWAWRVNPTVDEIDVVGYVDPHAEAIELLTGQIKLRPDRAFRSLAGALNATAADAVLVTTTLAEHAPLCREAIEAGMHVLVEKPFTESPAGARELVGLADRRGVVLMVSQNYRFFPAARAAAKLVAEGSLGALHEVAIDFRRNTASPPHRRTRLHVDPQPLLVDMSIHHFDLLRLITGRDPDRISCVTAAAPWAGFDGPPTAVASIVFGRVPVSYRGSWVSSGPKTAWAGEWRMDFERGHVAWTSRGDDGILDDRVVVTARGGKTRTMRLRRMARIDRAGTLTEFARSIIEKREPETSGRDNLKTMALAHAAVRSSGLGGEWTGLAG